jgi:hypothetical protein
VVGLAAHIGGYLLKSSAATEPLGLVADLLYALGWSLDAYEAALREQAGAGSNQASGDDEAPLGQ